PALSNARRLKKPEMSRPGLAAPGTGAGNLASSVVPCLKVGSSWKPKDAVLRLFDPGQGRPGLGWACRHRSGRGDLLPSSSDFSIKISPVISPSEVRET